MHIVVIVFIYVNHILANVRLQYDFMIWYDCSLTFFRGNFLQAYSYNDCIVFVGLCC